MITDDMTVQELLEHLTVRRFTAEADRLKDELFSELDRQLDAQIQQLVEFSHEKENAIVRLAEKASSSSSSTATKKTSSTHAPTTRGSVRIRVVVLAGPHKGEEFRLNVSPENPSVIGRSTSAKIRKTGVSLNRDLEASTYHAHLGVDLDSDQVYIEDIEYVFMTLRYVDDSNYHAG
jgi:hypothetical protein